MRLMILLSLFLMVEGCTLVSRPLPTYPQNLNVIKLSDGGVCLDAASAIRLVELQNQLIKW